MNINPYIFYLVAMTVVTALIAKGKNRNPFIWALMSALFFVPLFILLLLPEIEKPVPLDEEVLNFTSTPFNLKNDQLSFYNTCKSLIAELNQEKRDFDLFVKKHEDLKTIDKQCNLSQRSYRQIKKSVNLEIRKINSQYPGKTPSRIQQILGKYKQIKHSIDHAINALEGIEVDIEKGVLNYESIKQVIEKPIQCPGCGSRVSFLDANCDYCHAPLR